MTDYTITSWNQTNPEDFADYDAAHAAAVSRAASEETLIHIHDNSDGTRADVYVDGTIGKWHDDSPRTEKDDTADAADEIEDSA